jgi:hypothetical protein
MLQKLLYILREREREREREDERKGLDERKKKTRRFK